MIIDKLKNKILQLAIQGKLVEQNPNDIPVNVLLDEIRKEKERLIKDKKIKREKSLSEVADEEKEFELPNGWEWVRLGKVITLISGRDLSSSICNSNNLGIPYIMGASNMTEKGLVIERWVENPTVIGLKDDVMISVKGTVGKVEIISLEKVHLSRQVMSIRCLNRLINNKYIFIYLKSYMEKIKERSSGVIPGISRDDILKTPLAIPPLEEQQRIVDKVDKLFAIIDELNENKEAMLKNISHTRNKVLQLAIQGKLVEQSEDDESVEILLDGILTEKEKLINEKKIKKEKSLPEIMDEEKMFDIPDNWKWVRLCEIYRFIDYRGKTPNKIEEGIPLITAKNVKMGYLDYTIEEFISVEEFEERKSRGISKKGDILFTTEAPMGNVAIADIEKFSAGQRLITLQQYNDENILENKLFMYFIMSKFFQNQLMENKTGTTVYGIKAEKLKKLLLPLPPLNEQKRIVAKVDEIMSYLDELENTFLK